MSFCFGCFSHFSNFIFVQCGGFNLFLFYSGSLGSFARFSVFFSSFNTLFIMSQILAPLSLAQILDWTIVGILAHFLTQILSVYFLFVLFFLAWLFHCCVKVLWFTSFTKNTSRYSGWNYKQPCIYFFDTFNPVNLIVHTKTVISLIEDFCY